MGPWKRWATYRWPGFHVRNTFGAWFNNYLGGVTSREYAFAWKVNNFPGKDWTNELVSDADWARYQLEGHFGAAAKSHLTYGDVRTELNGFGLLEANTMTIGGAADDVASTFDAMSTNLGLHESNSRIRRGFSLADKKMRHYGANIESFHRAAAWAQGMGSTGGDMFGARAFTMMRHGDYADLTPFEDHIRDVIPFYKWLRTNIPYQIRQLAENPARTTFFSEKLKRSIYDAQGVDQTQAEMGQLDFQKQTLSVPIPSWVPVFGSKPGVDGMKFAAFDLPYTDLYTGLNDYISAGLPVFRNLIESYGFEKQAFTGKPLTGRMVKLSGFGALGAQIPVVGQILSGLGFTKKGADGEYYIHDRLENVLSAFPIYSRFRNFMEADPRRVQARASGILSMITGIGVKASDTTGAELDFYYNEVEPILQQYRDMGVVFPNAQDFVRGAQVVSPSGLGTGVFPGTFQAAAPTFQPTA